MALKQLGLVRRRADQSLQDFFDYHFQIHGQLSDAGEREATPVVYYQTHFFDTVYASSVQAGYWGHNDMTELYFTDAEHIRRVYSSQYVRAVVGPDGINFSNQSAVVTMIAHEDVLKEGPETRIVAFWWVQADSLNAVVLETFADMGKIVVNIAQPDEAGILRYFGSKGPQYNAVYQVYLPSRTQVPDFKRRVVEAAEKGGVLPTSICTFGIRALVFDQARGIRFDKSRQPQLQ